MQGKDNLVKKWVGLQRSNTGLQRLLIWLAMNGCLTKATQRDHARV